MLADLIADLLEEPQTPCLRRMKKTVAMKAENLQCTNQNKT